MIPPQAVNRWFLSYRAHEELKWHDVVAPEERYWADPFLVEHKKKHYVFFEDYDYDVGSIAYGTLSREGFEYGAKVLEGVHFSFPAIFEWNREYYMTPERRDIILYKATKFPDEWEEVRPIALGNYADPCVVEIMGEWYCFATEAEHELRIFKAERPDAQWKLWYAGNHKYSRNAGFPIVSQGGEVTRYVQIGDPDYGSYVGKKLSVAFGSGQYREGDTIKLPRFKEGLTGMHTWNRDSKFTITDGRIKL